MRRATFVLASAIVAVSAPALAKECRMPADAGAGMVRRSVDCEVPLRGGRPAAVDERNLHSDDGFVRLGPGTSVRISGRVRGEVIRKP